MGVDFYACNSCGDTFPDCGDHEGCIECGRKWCDIECGESEGLRPSLCDSCENDTGENCECEGSICGFCRKEKVEDHELLDYALDKLNVSRDEFAEEYLSQ